MRKFLSILIALSLVMSLFSGFVAAPKSVSAAEPAPTDVEILTPTGGTPFTPGDKFYVNAVVSNPDRVNGIADATATLTILGNAALVDGETATKAIDLPACGVADVWWQVVCTDPGDVTLTVTSGAGSGSVDIAQSGETPQGDDVVITWVETPCGEPFKGLVPVGTYFTVKALATLSSMFDGIYAESSGMTIKYDPAVVQLLSAETVPVGDLYYGRPEEAMWNFRCIAKGKTEISVEFISVDVDPANVIYPKPCVFTQGDPYIPPEDPGDWDLELTAPEKVCTNCAQNTFTVTAEASNGTAAADDVYAWLTIDSPLLAAFESGTVISKPGESVSAGSDSSLFTWNVICLGVGPTPLTVHLSHTPAGPEFLRKSITVQQKDYMVLLGDANDMVLDPITLINGTNPATQVYADPAADPAEFVNWHPETLMAETEVCDTFTVKTTFENCTCAAFGTPGVSQILAKVNLPSTVGLTGNITVEEWARVSDGTNPYGNSELKKSYQIPAQAVVDNGNILPLNTSCACCYFVITWKLTCTGSDYGQYKDVNFQAYLSTDTTTPLDETTFQLMQMSAPHVQTGIEYFQGWSSNSTLATTPISVIAAPCAPSTATPANNFTAVIAVANTGDTDVNNFVLNGMLVGDYTFVPGYYTTYPAGGTFTLNSDKTWSLTGLTLAAHRAYKVVLELTCSGPEDVVLSFTTATGVDALHDGTILGTYPRDLVTDTMDACGDYHVCLRGPKTLVQIPLSFEIIEPLNDGAHFLVSSDYAVKILVLNCSKVETEVFHGLTATLNWGSNDMVEFNQNVVPAETATHVLGDLGPGMYAETAWQIHCTGAGSLPFSWPPTMGGMPNGNADVNSGEPTNGASVTFTVTLNAVGPNYEVTRSRIVYQDPAAQISVEVRSPLVNPMQEIEYATGEKFAVTAYVKNNGPLPAKDIVIDVWSSVDPNLVPAYRVVDDPNTSPATTLPFDLLAGEGKYITWTMEVVRVTRPIEFVWAGPPAGGMSGSRIGLAYHGANTTWGIENLRLFNYPAAHLVVTLDPIPDVTAGTDFSITGTVTNIGGADATNVLLNLSTVYGDVAPAVGSSFTKYIGTLPGNHTGVDPFTVPFTWNLQSEGSGKTSIHVTAEGRDEYGFSNLFAVGWEREYTTWELLEDWYGDMSVNPFWRSWEEFAMPLAPIPAFCIESADATFKQLDNVNPVITPTAGQDGAIVNDPHFTLTGTATDNDGVASFYINGMLVSVMADGTFACDVVLAEGANTFEYKAFDAADNMAMTSITVTYVVPVDPLLKTATLSYIEGWNLVTVPLNSTTLSGLAGDANFTGEIYGYSQTAGWFIPTGFEAGQGYWLNMKAAGTATIYGYEVASPQLSNYASGWVLIGSPYSVGGDTVRVIVGVNPPMLLKDAVASSFVGNIFYFDGSWKAFDATTDAIQPGLGYWVEVKSAASIVFVKP